MGLIFLSHSSRDSAKAVTVRDWLAAQGWDEVFLDLDPSAGLAPGQRWRDELRKAGERCSAVVVLVSPYWAASKWCLAEFLFAAQLGKEIFPALIAECPTRDLPIELTATYQFVDISTPERLLDGLERLRLGLQRAGLHPNAFPWPPKDEPKRPIFRGMRVLEETDAAIFFGRDVQITKALDAIRRLRDGLPEQMLAILGASGAGKSSFLRAGLLARLKRDAGRFLVLPTMRPGRAALSGDTGLRAAVGLNGTLDERTIAQRFSELRTRAIEHLKKHGLERISSDVPKPPTVILPIDQAEELFVVGDSEAAAAVTLLASIVSIEPELLLLVTIRSDSLGLLQGDPFLGGIPRLPFDLPKLSPSAFREIIQGPTTLPGTQVEIGAELCEMLVRDFNGTDALPLLAFTLERLILDHHAKGPIEQREYVEAMKGVGGAIRKAVESAFAKAAETPGLPTSRAELDAMARRTFVPGLVRIDDAASAPKRRVALRSQLPEDALPLVDCLVDQRLLVTDAFGAERTVEVSHEAVLRHWRELEGWIGDRRDDLSLAERVSEAAHDWQIAKGQVGYARDALVHRGERLRAAEKLFEWDDLRRQVDDETVAYISACRDAEAGEDAAKDAQRQRQRQLRRWIGRLVAAAAVVTVLGAALVVAGQRNLVYARSLTLARTAESFAEQHDRVRALRLSILAARGNWLLPASAEGHDALSSNAQSLNLLSEFRGHGSAINGAVFSHDATHILTWSEDSTARLWNATTGLPILPPFKHEKSIEGAAFSKDDTRILTWGWDSTARLWDASTGAQIGPGFVHDDVINGAAFSKDSSRVLTWSQDGSARVWETSTGMEIGPGVVHDERVRGALFSKDETRVLTWSGNTAQIWDIATGAPIGRPLGEEHGIGKALFSPDETRVLTWSFYDTAQLWNAVTGKPIGSIMKHGELAASNELTDDIRHGDPFGGAIFSKDTTRILTWGWDNTARIWNATTGVPIGEPLKHDAEVYGATFSNDDTRILTWSDDKTTRFWNARAGWPGQVLTHDDGVRGAAFSNDETRILTWGAGHTARLWDAASGTPIGAVFSHDARLRGAIFSDDSKRILSWSDDGIARLWSATPDAPIAMVIAPRNPIHGAVLVGNETRLLTWHFDNTVRFWNLATGALIGRAITHDERLDGVVVSRDESRLLTWGRENAQIWDAATGAPITPPLQHDRFIEGGLFSNDGTRVLTWSSDSTARLWEVTTGRQVAPPFRHDDWVTGGLFSNDGTRILTWSRVDHTARLWNASNGTPIGQTLRQDDGIDGALFSKDDTRVLTWGWSDTARVWNAATGTPVGQALRHDALISGADFSHDETRVLTWSFDNTARIWNAENGEPIGAALRHDRRVLGATFSKDDTRVLTWSEDHTARLWNAKTGLAMGPVLRHDGTVNGAAFSKDDARIMTWSDKTAQLWNAATGGLIRPPLRHDDEVRHAAFSKDGNSVLTWSDQQVRLWDLRWAIRDTADPRFVEDICRAKLVGGVTQSSADRMSGVRYLDRLEAVAAPILRDREGEDVCGPPPTPWETLRSLLGLK